MYTLKTQRNFTLIPDPIHFPSIISDKTAIILWSFRQKDLYPESCNSKFSVFLHVLCVIPFFFLGGGGIMLIINNRYVKSQPISPLGPNFDGFCANNTTKRKIVVFTWFSLWKFPHSRMSKWPIHHLIYLFIFYFFGGGSGILTLYYA